MLLPMVYAMVMWHLVYCVCAIIRIASHYLSDGERSTWSRFVAVSFAFILGVELWLGLAYILINVTWFLLAALIDPTVYFPAAVAVVVLLAVVVKLYESIRTQITSFRAGMQECISQKMQKCINRAELRSEHQTDNQKKADAQFNPAELFRLLNTNGDDTLDMDEFKKLFASLNVEMSAERQKRLVVFCDTNCSGTIDEDEFVSSWAIFQEAVIHEAAEQAGLTSFHLVVKVFGVTGMMVMVFVFIYSALSAWQNSTDVSSVLRSVMVMGLAAFGSLLKSFSSKGATDGNQKANINEAMKMFNDDDTDDTE